MEPYIDPSYTLRRQALDYAFRMRPYDAVMGGHQPALPDEVDELLRNADKFLVFLEADEFKAD